MNGKPKVLILKDDQSRRFRRLDFKLSKSRALNSLKDCNVKPLHDSGGRILIIDGTDENLKALQRLLPDAEIVDLKENIAERTSDLELDQSETLFIEALKIRTSEKYREAKKNRKFGESPEEQELATGSCVREEY